MEMLGKVLLNRYRLEFLLARGGMAEVHRATDLKLCRSVAVKILHPHLASDPAFVERLQHEVRTVATLAHPCIVQVYDYGEDNGRPFLVMELVEGESLASLLDRPGVLSLERAMEIIRDVLTALKYVHAQGLVHRDIKPHNVLITPEGRAKLADFGIVHGSAAHTLTQAGEVLGSIHYLAPERLLGQPTTPVADLYGVGVMFYQMLTGRLPFDGDATALVAAQHLHKDPVPPSALRPDMPAWLDQIVLRALAKDPDVRYVSAAAVLDDLVRLQAGTHDEPTVRVPIGISSTAASRPRTEGEVRDVSRRRLHSRTVYAIALGTALILTLLGLLWSRGLGSVDGRPVAKGAVPTSVPAALPINSPTAQATMTPTVAAAQPTPKPPDRATATPTALQRLSQLEDVVRNSTLAGQHGKEEREVSKGLAEIRKKVTAGDTKEAFQATQDLIDKVRKMAGDKGIDRQLSEQLTVQLAALASQLR